MSFSSLENDFKRFESIMRYQCTGIHLHSRPWSKSSLQIEPGIYFVSTSCFVTHMKKLSADYLSFDVLVCVGDLLADLKCWTYHLNWSVCWYEYLSFPYIIGIVSCLLLDLESCPHFHLHQPYVFHCLKLYCYVLIVEHVILSTFNFQFHTFWYHSWFNDDSAMRF